MTDTREPLNDPATEPTITIGTDPAPSPSLTLCRVLIYQGTAEWVGESTSEARTWVTPEQPVQTAFGRLEEAVRVRFPRAERRSTLLYQAAEALYRAATEAKRAEDEELTQVIGPVHTARHQAKQEGASRD